MYIHYIYSISRKHCAEDEAQGVRTLLQHKVKLSVALSLSPTLNTIIAQPNML